MYVSVTPSNASEQRMAWELLNNSPTMRMLSAISRRKMQGEVKLEAQETDRAYFRRRAVEERQAAELAAGLEARTVHNMLADLYHGRSMSETGNRLERDINSTEYREALLDDALDDSFPASDPPSVVLPGRVY